MLYQHKGIFRYYGGFPYHTSLSGFLSYVYFSLHALNNFCYSFYGIIPY